MYGEDLTQKDLSKIQTAIDNIHSICCLLCDYCEYNYSSIHIPEVACAAEIMKEKCHEVMNLF